MHEITVNGKRATLIKTRRDTAPSKTHSMLRRPHANDENSSYRLHLRSFHSRRDVILSLTSSPPPEESNVRSLSITRREPSPFTVACWGSQINECNASSKENVRVNTDTKEQN